MDKIYTEADLTKLNKEDMISVFMIMQKLVENLSLTCAEQKVQLEQVNQNMNLILEQLRISKNKQFGRSSEKIVYDGQLELCFDEAEATIVNKYVVEPYMEEVCPKPYKRKKVKGQREEDLKDIPIVVINHELSDEELSERLVINGNAFLMRFIKGLPSIQQNLKWKNIMLLFMLETIMKPLFVAIAQPIC